MDRPQTLASALEALDAANARAATLASDVSAFAQLSTEHTATVSALTEIAAEHAELSQSHATLSAELEALKASQKTLEAEANLRATAIVASLGVPPVSLPTGAQAVTKPKPELWAEYNALPVAERNAFYAKHRAAMRD